MNGKLLNSVLNYLPVSSEWIGSPRQSASMLDCAAAGKGDIEIEIKGKLNDSILPPAFFNWNPGDFAQPFLYVAKLKNGRIWGRNGAVITASDVFVADVCREFNVGTNIDHSIFYTVRQARPTQLKGIAAVIGTAGANIYYHWMIDVLPRLCLVLQQMSVEQIDYFITDFDGLPFQLECLQRLNVSTDKIVCATDNWRFHVKCEKLIVPSLAGTLDRPNSFQINCLTSMFNDCTQTIQPYRRIYISRKQVGRRMLVNEENILALLKPLNFEVIQCEQMTVAEQAKIFSESAVIVCSHGSALTNLVFCQPHTLVIDIFNASHLNPCFWFIARHRRLNYNQISGKSVAIDGNAKNDNTWVSEALLLQLLNENGVSI